jgi:peptidoglycan/LPS O-acetylase OafA/YrhL
MNYIKGFDSFRAISIVFVMASHLGLYNLLPNNVFFKERIWRLISGTTGVNIFFTLSGFLITMILIQEFNKNGKIKILNFFARRFLRLVPPLILFYLMIAILMNFRLIHTSSIGFLYSILYVYNYMPRALLTPELVHTWSLAIEEQFYLFLPFVLNVFKGNFKRIGYLVFFLVSVGVFSIYVVSEWEDLYTSNRWFFPATFPIFVGSFFA